MTGFAASGGVGGPFTRTAQSFSLTNLGTNTLTWSLVNTSAWLTVSSAGGPLPAGGFVADVTVCLNTTASNLLVGNYSATLWFTNLSDNFGQSRQFALSVISPPAITAQPADQSVLEGAPAAFSVAAVGGLPLSYQWQNNGTNLVDDGNLAGSTTTNLLVRQVTAAHGGSYTVVVANAAGTVTSSNAMLTLIPSPPVITLQPADATVVVNGPARFFVAALGTQPIAYQWSFNGTNLLAGATNSWLTLTNVQYSQSGVYAVTVTNIFGATNSSNAALTVTPCAPAPAGLVSWWAAEGNAWDQIGGNHGTLFGNASYGAGEVGWGFVFDGSSDGVFVGNPTNLQLQNFTIEAWIKRSSSTAVSGSAPNAWLFGYGSNGYGFELWNDGRISLTKAGVDEVDGSISITDTNLHHVAVTKNGSTVTFYVDGVGCPPVVYSAVFSFTTSAAIGCLGTTTCSFLGLMDEVSVYNRPLSAAEVQGIYLANSGGKCFTPVPPTITSQPTNQTVFAGQTASFSVLASGTPPLTYQWACNTTNLAGATNATLLFPAAQFTNAGTYSVTVRSPFAATLSSNAILTVNNKLDHFAWSPIPSPRFVNVPFAVTIQALDATNGMFTDFTGPALLSSTNGMPVNPTVTAAFAQGTWTGLINISQPATNLVLRVAGGNGEAGLAKSINVVNLPTLGFTPSGNFLMVYWPVAASNFVLETSTNLSPAQWHPMDSPPLKIGDQYLESIQMNSANQFYRLWYIGP